MDSFLSLMALVQPPLPDAESSSGYMMAMQKGLGFVEHAAQRT